MLCCPQCFGDRGLTKNIIPLKSREVGKCSFCQSENVPLVTPESLIDYFELLRGIYTPDAGGQLLVELFKEDWQLFDNQTLNNDLVLELLARIYEDRDLVRTTFSPSSIYQSNRLQQWEALREELRTRNRYFPDSELDKSRLDELLGHLLAEPLQRQWFRARLMVDEKVFPLSEMGAPPNRNALAGRANPIGIPYLYLGSTPITAIAELRPHTGEHACIAEFQIGNELRVIDLRNPRKFVSPFLLSDENDVGHLRVDIGYLERLGAELTRPVSPHAAAVDYIPSQYLCEFIKKSGYDGVLYRSSVSEGINLALFKPELATPQSLERYLVERVSVEAKPAP